jgi:hypothetical protein
VINICACKQNQIILLWAINRNNNNNNNNIYDSILEIAGFCLSYVGKFIQEVPHIFFGTFPFSQRSVFLYDQYKSGNSVQPNTGPGSEFRPNELNQSECPSLFLSLTHTHNHTIQVY